MLKYIGNGSFIIDIPARDLTDDEVKLYGGVVALVKTGLYEKVEEKSPSRDSQGSPAKEPVKKDGK